MNFIVFGWFPIACTLLTLALCFAAALAVEFSMGTTIARRIVLLATALSAIVWLIVIVERFLSIAP